MTNIYLMLKYTKDICRMSMYTKDICRMSMYTKDICRMSMYTKDIYRMLMYTNYAKYTNDIYRMLRNFIRLMKLTGQVGKYFTLFHAKFTVPKFMGGGRGVYKNTHIKCNHLLKLYIFSPDEGGYCHSLPINDCRLNCRPMSHTHKLIYIKDKN